MSSIKVGDLVVVIRPASCCGTDDGIGKVGTVERINSKPVICLVCNGVISGTPVAYLPEHRGWGEVSRLKRIDPPALPEDVERQEEIHA